MKSVFFSLLIFINITVFAGINNRIDSLKKVIKQEKSDTSIINNYNKISDVFFKLNKDSCKFYSDIAIKLSKQINYNNGLAKAYHKKAIVEFYSNKLIDAITYLKYEVNYLPDSNTAKIKPLSYIGFCYESLGQLDSAEFFYLKTMDIAKSKKSYDDIVSMYNQLGNIYRAKSIYKKAIDYYYKSINIADSLKQTTTDRKKIEFINNRIADTYANIANVYFNMKEYDNVIKIYKKSYNIKLQNNDSVGFSPLLTNIGSVYYKIEKYDSALFYYKKAINKGFSINEGQSYQNSLYNMGALYSKFGDNKKALEYTNKYLRYSEQIGDSVGISRGLIQLSKIFYETKDYKKAIEYIKKGVVYPKNHNLLSLELDAYKNIHIIYYSIKKYKEAYKYFKLYKQISDSIFNKEKTKAITEIETKYETEKKEQKIKEQENLLKLQQADNKLKSTEIKRQKTQKYYFGAGFVILLLILFFIIKNFKQKRKNLELKLEKEAISASLKGQEQEREKIAEELHDDIGSLLASLNLLLSRIIKENKDIKELPQISEKLNQTYKYIRLTSHQLAHFSKLNKTLLEGVEEFIDSIKHTQSAVITYKNNLKIDINNINEQLKIDIYRTIQELIINAIKHSKAENITLLLSNDKTNLNIVVLDDGKGFNKNEKHGIGLNNIKQRLKSLNGEIEIESIENEGTTIKVKIPV